MPEPKTKQPITRPRIHCSYSAPLVGGTSLASMSIPALYAGGEGWRAEPKMVDEPHAKRALIRLGGQRQGLTSCGVAFSDATLKGQTAFHPRRPGPAPSVS